MPLGDGFGNLIRTPGITPLSSGVQAVRNPAGDILQNLGQEVESRVKPLAMEKARQAGLRDGDNGTIQDRVPITDMDVAYEQAARTAYVARTNLDRDAILEGLAVEHQYDPEGFQQKALEARQEILSKAQPEYAVQIEQLWDRDIQRRAFRIQHAKRDKDAQEAKSSVDTRIQSIQGALEAHANNGTIQSQAAQELQTELTGLIDQKIANPIWNYTSEQAQRDSRVMASRLTAITAGQEVLSIFTDAQSQGKTVLEAEALARESFRQRFVQDPTLSNLPPDQQQQLRGMADNALNARVQVAREEERAKQAQEREAEKAHNERLRDNFDSLLPAADAGQLSIARIGQERDAGNINARQADSLIGQVRAAQSRADQLARQTRAAERGASAAERTAGATMRMERKYDLQDLARTNPDAAEAQAEADYRRGTLRRSDLEAIRSIARGENNSDDAERKRVMTDTAKQYGFGNRQREALERAYDSYIDRNPNATSAERDTFRDRAVNRLQQRTTTRNPTGQARSPQAIISHGQTVTRRNGPATGQSVEETRRLLQEATAAADAAKGNNRR